MRKSDKLDTNITQIVDWINRWSENPVSFTVAIAGTEVKVAHQLGKIPSFAVQLITEDSTDHGVVYPGATAWTNTHIYITASVAGDYSIMLRR